MTVNKLTAKQKKFGEFFAASGNGTDAAIKAGYSEKTAAAMAAENLRKPHIMAYIDSIAKKADEERVLNALDRQIWLSKVILGKIEEPTLSALGDIVYMPAKLNTRVRAAELLAKMRGELNEKPQTEQPRVQQIPRFETIEAYTEWKKAQLEQASKTH